MRTALLLAAVGLAASGCAAAPGSMTGSATETRPGSRSYLVSPDANADVDAALSRAKASGKRVLLVMGANWCSDSRALAGWLETDRFVELISRRYELVFVNIGMPRSGDGHNLEIARRFGLADLPGLPNVLIITADGVLVNPDTATSWRNAESRTEQAIYDELTSLSEAPA